MSEKLPDSIISAKERAVKIKAERDAIEAAQAAADAEKKTKQDALDQKAQTQEDDFIKVLAERSPDTREHLLERVRQKREEPGVNVMPPRPEPYLSQRMKEQLEREKAGGAAVVARNEERLKATRDAHARMKAEEEAKLGQMQPVHRHNPSMDEKFPVNKATIK